MGGIAVVGAPDQLHEADYWARRERDHGDGKAAEAFWRQYEENYRVLVSVATQTFRAAGRGPAEAWLDAEDVIGKAALYWWSKAVWTKVDAERTTPDGRAYGLKAWFLWKIERLARDGFDKSIATAQQDDDAGHAFHPGKVASVGLQKSGNGGDELLPRDTIDRVDRELDQLLDLGLVGRSASERGHTDGGGVPIGTATLPGYRYTFNPQLVEWGPPKYIEAPNLGRIDRGRTRVRWTHDGEKVTVTEVLSARRSGWVKHEDTKTISLVEPDIWVPVRVTNVLTALRDRGYNDLATILWSRLMGHSWEAIRDHLGLKTAGAAEKRALRDRRQLFVALMEERAEKYGTSTVKYADCAEKLGVPSFPKVDDALVDPEPVPARCPVCAIDDEPGSVEGGRWRTHRPYVCTATGVGVPIGTWAFVGGALVIDGSRWKPWTRIPLTALGQKNRLRERHLDAHSQTAQRIDAAAAPASEYNEDRVLDLRGTTIDDDGNEIGGDEEPKVVAGETTEADE